MATRIFATPAGRPGAGLLLHEWLCIALFAWLLLRLVFSVGIFAWESVFIAFLLAANCAVLALFPYGEHLDRSWRLRLLFYPAAMNMLYFALRTAIPAFHPATEDAALQAVDRLIVGTNLSLRVQPLIHPVLTDFFSFCYMLYFVYLIFGQLSYLFGELSVLRKFYSGLFSIYALGYFGYLTVPAGGPILAMESQFGAPLAGGWFTAANAALVAGGTNGVDVFPSLHCGLSLYILLSDHQHKRWRFWSYLVFCIGFWISTIYLRYHYFIDVVCGFALGWAMWRIANLKPRESAA
ncbi:MAG TPA: phosphatase PAP2 family protein [Burkholderiales bacterium]|nr:phosphatase PAP2 family protein [Burkholderiales bacterium]